MKPLNINTTLFLIILLFPILSYTQVPKDSANFIPITLPQYCDKADIELIASDSFPAGYMIFGMSSIERIEGVDDISELSDKDLKTIRKFAKVMKCCSVFIDFQNVVKNENAETRIRFYAVRRIIYIKGAK